MKRTGKMIGIAAAMVLALTVIGCKTDAKEDTAAPVTVLSDVYQTFYLNIADEGLGGLEGFHIKNLGTASAGIVIDRVFASTTKSEAGAVDVFTFAVPETGTNYWGFGAGTIANGEWSSGEVAAPVAPELEVYSTGFATSVFVDAVYVGVVAKNLSATVSGGKLSFVPIISGTVETAKAKTFEEFFK